MKLIGVVMCGGQSSRMGTDKGLLLQNNVTWASMAAQKLKPYVADVYFSININQIKHYSEVFEVSKLIPDSLEIHGPLCGLLSVHQKLNSNDLLILACDMIAIQPKTIEKLVNLHAVNQKNEVFVYKNNTELEPLMGIHTAKGLNKIFDLANQNKLQKHSMKYALALLDTSEISIQDSQLAEFKNCNTPNDIVL